MEHQPKDTQVPTPTATSPHLTLRETYMQDPSTSTWRVDISGTAHLPSPAYPQGRRRSSASPWPEKNHWMMSDGQRREKAAREIAVYELLVERRPVTPEDHFVRRHRLLTSEDEVDAMQRKESMLAAGGMRKSRRTNGDGQSASVGIRAKHTLLDHDADELTETLALCSDATNTYASHKLTTTEFSSKDVPCEGSSGVPSQSAFDDFYTGGVIDEHAQIARKEEAKAGENGLQLKLDTVATLLMLIGLLAVYSTATA